MRIALIDIKGDDARTIDKNNSVNIRNMVELADKIGAKFYYNTKMLDNEKYDVVIFGFGSISNEINKTSDFVLKCGAKRLFWLVGDIDQSMNQSLFYTCKKTGLSFETLQNHEIEKSNFGAKCSKQNYIDLNTLLCKPHNQLSQKKYDCIYYGRWRKDRVIYFKKYLKHGVYLSTSIKNMKLFKHIGCNAKTVDKISWAPRKETLNLFRYSLYMEDVANHDIYSGLPNRWYESGFCNNVVFFDIDCWNTIRKSEISQFEDQIKEYIVTSHDDLMAKIEYCNQDFGKHLAIQKTWRLSEQLLKAQMIEKIKLIINGIR